MRTRAPAAVLMLVAALAAPAGVARAQDDTIAVPRIAIYPGDTITAAMIEDRRMAPSGRANQRALHASREQVLGKVARLTLLPGRAIPLNGVREPDAVRSGKSVTLVYSTGELTITGRGLAMQAGAIGDMVSVQSSDGGAIVRGKVQADGSVLLED